MNKFYLTTSISYPNANPHIGHALEMVQADFLARYYRLAGREVYFLTGVDEHGQKIQNTALADGIAPKDFVDQKSQVFKELTERLKLTDDRFIRTTDPDHIRMAQALWRACAARGDIYKKKYRAWYNVKEEEFLGSADENPDPAVFGVDHQHIKLIDEENYFFALSRYHEQVLQVLKSEELQVYPAFRRSELIKFIEDKGLQDVSISREKSKLEWGIEVPEDQEQVMYVWFDALANYLTAVGKVDDRGIIRLSNFWPADLHCIGKDISRFHAMLWPGMLLSAGLALPKSLLIHGFIISGGQKMSKSIGNVIDPLEQLDRYGVDTLRWVLLKDISTGGDADYTEERVQQLYKADLANDYGNLISRVWTMVQKYCDGKVPEKGEAPEIFKEKLRLYHQSVEEREIDRGLRYVQDLLVYANQQIEERKPWVLAKDQGHKAELDQLLYQLLEIIRLVSVLLQPVLTEAIEVLKTRLFPNLSPESWDSFEQAEQWGQLKPGSSLGTEAVILFPKDD